MSIYVDGRERAYYWYEGGVSPTGIRPTADYAVEPSGAVRVRFGHGEVYRRWPAPFGALFDDLRISEGTRYTSDFDRPSRPLVSDSATWARIDFERGWLGGHAEGRLSFSEAAP